MRRSRVLRSDLACPACGDAVQWLGDRFDLISFDCLACGCCGDVDEYDRLIEACR